MQTREQSASQLSQLNQANQLAQKVAYTTQDCEAICLQTIQYCLEMGGLHAEPTHMRILQDCADICETSARFVLRRSQAQEHTAELCAEICEICAASCEQFAMDPQMKACANQCHLCALVCHELGKTAQAFLGTEGVRGKHGRSFLRTEPMSK